MKLYYKTPRYKNSNFMAHMVEHLVLHPEDASDTDRYVYLSNIDGYSASDYIYFVYDEFSIDEEFIKTIISRNITQDLMDYEYAIFEEEFGERGYVKRLVDKLYQMIYWNDRSSKPVKYEVDEVKEYIDKNIMDGKTIYYDNYNFKIVKTNIDYKIIDFDGSYWEILYKMILLEWSKNHIFYKRIDNTYDFVLLDFINDLFSSYDLYQKRYNLWSYYHSNTTYLVNCDYVGIRAGVNAICDVSEKYFDSYKKYAINGVNNGTYEINNIYGIMYIGQYVEKDNIIKYIENLPYSYIKNLVEMIER